MPQNREQHLLRRREQLVARSAQLRGELAIQAGHLAPQGLMTGGIRHAWEWVQQHPQWVVGGIVLVLAMRPRRMVRWGGRFLAVWQIARRAAPLWQALLTRRR